MSFLPKIEILSKKGGSIDKCDVKVMPCPFTSPKMFCAGPNILCQLKNLTAFSAFSKTLCWHKNQITECKSSFYMAQNVCDWHNM